MASSKGGEVEWLTELTASRRIPPYIHHPFNLLAINRGHSL